MTEEPSLPDIVRWLKASKRERNRRLALSALLAVAFASPFAAGGLAYIHRNDKPLAVSVQPAREEAREVASPKATHSAVEPVSPRHREPSARTGETPRRRVTTTAPAARLAPDVARRCSDLLERASLGETLTDDERVFLRTDCR